MDFFHSQESLTAMQWILRAVVAYFFMLITAKLMGQRSISQLRLLDFVIALIIGNIIAHPLSDEGLGLKGSMITMSVLVVLYTSSVIVSLKSEKLRNFFDSSPLPLIKNGKILYKNLGKARITLDDLMAELRKASVEDIQKVALALWESGGTLSFFLKPQYQPVTPLDLNFPPKSFVFPRTIIKERKIDVSLLHAMGREENWLKLKIKSTYNADIHNILLATIDETEHITIFLYE
ncbi:DUF421 domain-containing protein [Lederbergia lenta]|uniref:UPF0702 transmembrane protein ykjA ORF3 n=1 Tax=Lederbergia lenta TaxID=1467 RepID=A0A2X4ZAA3_LEDLE|nr:DUF421 domain-containing protein [Lederbergia lenta]MCM3109391.1 DUF421 domain-containing protein [Lederbergia lenta]MEC2324844.1 DUF421 domain-containing protein [Lederbergia lenta]SQI57484.1 UPF0702 transmembrane protein ykjA ORF3 [Lederbergia lenta]